MESSQSVDERFMLNSFFFGDTMIYKEFRGFLLAAILL